MKKLIYHLLLLVLVPFSAHPQDNTMERISRDYQQQVKRNSSDFTDYVTKRDKEFASQLKHYWKEFRLLAPLMPETTPKPFLVPRYKTPENESVSRLLPVVPSGIPTFPEEFQIPKLLVPENPVAVDSSLEKITFLYCGSMVTLKYNPDIKVEIPAEINGPELAKFWERINVTHYGSLLLSLESERNSMQINGWGFLQLVRKTAVQLYPGSTNAENLLTWYLMTKAGYKIRVAYHENAIYLMMPFSNTLYGVNYTKFDGLNYYLLDKGVSEIATYDVDFPDATKIIDLNLYTAPTIGNLNATQILRFTYNNTPYEIPLKYNMNAIEFFKDYPLTDIQVTFNAAVSNAFKESVVEKLKPLVENKTEKEAVGFLLTLVQNGFEYKTDEEQFGHEKFNFPEENLFYPFNDCNDRAVLFAYLVENIVGLDVIGVEYPGHIATAVHFYEDVPGDYISWKGINYVMADPTFINAPIGMTMPQYVNTKADIIEVNAPCELREKVAEIHNTVIFSANGDFNLVNSLKTENDKLVSGNCEKSIAGFFAAINLAKLNNISIPGKSIQETLDKYNPTFRNSAPSIYQNIGKLQVLKNSDGVITVKTENGKSITFEKIRIANDARMKIISLPNGDARIDILSGIKVGKAIVWFSLNSVRLFRSNGNLLFDYDSDHTQALVNLRKDILN